MNKAIEIASDEIRGVIGRLRKCSGEPQVCIPDIFVWLRKGKNRERIAYTRFNPADVVYSKKKHLRGEEGWWWLVVFM